MFRFGNQKGFTLMELMVVVIIVMVLAGIAVPVYMHYIKEGKKTEAYAILDAYIAGAKVYFQRNETFTGGTDALWLVDDDVANAEYFTYEITEADDEGFEVVATANADWAEDATITYGHAGADGSTGDVGQAETDPMFVEAGF